MALAAVHPGRLHSFPTRRSSDLPAAWRLAARLVASAGCDGVVCATGLGPEGATPAAIAALRPRARGPWRSEENTSELQSRENILCRLLLAKKKTTLSIIS